VDLSLHDARLTVRPEHIEGTTVLALYGRLDAGTILDFRRAMRHTAARSPMAIVVDLSAVNFVDAAGTRALESVTERYRPLGIRVIVVPGSSRVQRMLDRSVGDGRLVYLD
jgi:anti-anti-sigma factor